MRKSKKNDTIKLLNSLPTTLISNLKLNTLSKIEGELEVEKSMISLLTKSRCIGYCYEEKKWTSRKPFKNDHSDKTFKIISSQTECRDFFIKDKSGRIKVNAFNIEIHLYINETKKNNHGTVLIENLLLADNTKYIMLGTTSQNDDKNIEFSKSFFDDKLIIMDEKFYNIYIDKNPFYRVGCAILLIILAIAFFSVFINAFFFWT